MTGDGRSKARKPFTHDEDIEMIKFLMQQNISSKDALCRKAWDLAERRGVAKHHTAESMRTHFRRTLQYRVKNLKAQIKKCDCGSLPKNDEKDEIHTQFYSSDDVNSNSLIPYRFSPGKEIMNSDSCNIDLWYEAQQANDSVVKKEYEDEDQSIENNELLNAEKVKICNFLAAVYTHYDVTWLDALEVLRIVQGNKKKALKVYQHTMFILNLQSCKKNAIIVKKLIGSDGKNYLVHLRDGPSFVTKELVSMVRWSYL